MGFGALMGFAGHLPTKHFDHAEWQAMPVWSPRDEGEMAPDGWQPRGVA
jgi:hypothetical protein